jgi:hypothetical protein
MAVQCGTVTVLCCVTVYVLVFGVCYGSAVWHGYRSVLCDTVYIGIRCLSVLRTALLSLWKEQANKLG